MQTEARPRLQEQRGRRRKDSGLRSEGNALNWLEGAGGHTTLHILSFLIN